MHSVLSINSGSSSLRFALLKAGESFAPFLTGKFDRIGLPDPGLSLTDVRAKQSDERRIDAPNHVACVLPLMELLEQKAGDCDVTAIGHRVVHGGPHYRDPQRVDNAMIEELRRISSFAPNHLPSEIALMEVFTKRFPQVPQIACFDTTFHRDMPRVAKLLPIPRRYDAKGVQRYGFHGLSYAYLMEELARLGVVRNGEPQYAGSNTGDPGLSSALAEMKADWDTVKGRLGFNNPDAYGTTVSLRTENFRILPTTNSDTVWKDLLQRNRLRDLLADEDVRRNCLQISRGDGLPVPGIIIEFSTTITDGYNVFGQPGAAGDHAFSPSSFATKIFGTGVALEGYRGMDQPAANGTSGGTSPSDPSLWYLDPLALMATPYVYLIPVGVDSMRSPPLGDTSGVRSWTVDDVAIPLPFNIGASQMADGGYYQSSDFLGEPLFALRQHQAFRPVPSASYFSTSLYGGGGSLLRSQYTNNRLIGRSVWNSKWKLVIPGHTMLNDPDEALERFIKTVRDIKLHFVTYSYSGN